MFFFSFFFTLFQQISSRASNNTKNMYSVFFSSGIFDFIKLPNVEWMQLCSNFITISNIAARYRLKMGVYWKRIWRRKEKERRRCKHRTHVNASILSGLWSQYRAKFYSYRFWLLFRLLSLSTSIRVGYTFYLLFLFSESVFSLVEYRNVRIILMASEMKRSKRDSNCVRRMQWYTKMTT